MTELAMPTWGQAPREPALNEVEGSKPSEAQQRILERNDALNRSSYFFVN